MARKRNLIPTTSISVRGDEIFITKINTLAASRKMHVADLTRAAYEKAFGDDLARLEIFFNESGTLINQSVHKGYKKEGGAA